MKPSEKIFNEVGYGISEESRMLIKSLDTRLDTSKNESADLKALLADKDRKIAELETKVDILERRLSESSDLEGKDGE